MYLEQDVRAAALEYFNGNQLAADVWVSKYALRSPDGLAELTPEDMHRRLAKEFARIESNYPNPMLEEHIYELLKDFEYVIPQGSPMSGIGNPYQVQSLSNCFVLRSPEDSYGGICLTDQEQAQLMKRRGGVGFDISNIRPKGLNTKNAAGTTDGIGLFMQRWSNTCREVAQDGRRGALMLTCSVHHPEILTFINIKKDLTKVTGANITITLTDEFRKAVEEDTTYEQRWPLTGVPKITRQVNAKTIWNEIVKAARDCAEPGLAFIDTIKKNTPSDLYAEFITIGCNPCVTGDTWILTSAGWRRAHTLLGQQVALKLDNYDILSTPQGFFSTGESNVFELTLASGHRVNATKNHKFLTYSGWKELSDLSIGTDEILLPNSQLYTFPDTTTDKFKQGYLVGAVTGDGWLGETEAQCAVWTTAQPGWQGIKEQLETCWSVLKLRSDFKGFRQEHNNKLFFNSTSLATLCHHYLTETKSLQDVLIQEDCDFLAGFLRGIFDADGSVQGTHKKGVSIRLGSIKLDLLEDIQRLLSLFGIYSNIYQNRNSDFPEYRLLPDTNRKPKLYLCQPIHELVISNASLQNYNAYIGFSDTGKKDRLENLLKSYQRSLNKDKHFSRVEAIKEIGTRPVFDVTTISVNEQYQAFNANGLWAHNCSEIWMCADDSCRLMILNLFSYVINPYTSDARFDYSLFSKHTQQAMRLMDDLVDLEIEQIDKILAKIDLDPESEEIKQVERNLWQRIKNTAVRGRRTGLGWTGLGDTLAALGFIYGSQESIPIVISIQKTFAKAAYDSTINLAKERGAFPAFDYEKEKDSQYLNRVITNKTDWQVYGRRNIALLTEAPTGSSSMLAKLKLNFDKTELTNKFTQIRLFGTTSGIEPTLFLQSERRRKVNSPADFTDATGDHWQKYLVDHPGYYLYKSITGDLSENSIYHNSLANSIDWKARVQLQAAIQQYVCHAISSTINLPENVSYQEVSDIYMTAWKAGCKGITVYREGSRSGVIVDPKKQPKALFNHVNAPKRPELLEAHIYDCFVRDRGNMRIIIGLLDKKPFEVFIIPKDDHALPEQLFVKKSSLKRGNRYALVAEKVHVKDIVSLAEPNAAALTRLVSMSLRHGAAPEFVVEQLNKAKDTDFGSLPGVLARVLKTYVNKKVDGECPQCSNPTLVCVEGCTQCTACGWSKC